MLLHKTPTAVFKQSWRTLLKAVLSLPVPREWWVWAEPFPTLSWQGAVTAHAEHIQTVAVFPVKHMLPWASGAELAAFCPRPFHAPNSTWREPVIYRKEREFSSIGLFLANHCSSRNILAVSCPASGNIVRSVSWKSPDILQLIWRVLYAIQKKKKKREMLDWIQQPVS